ncbi:DUF92 domain-containing protein [Ammoniphilus sp. CFH 90114]|uniref:DUF92 domain-containing protein n=1 Tax=Ammoniphilus sp. CFH 90114 TaxID=2493665 RepID=UPI00100E8DC8|nr:DUF92 domain-containing protein [Ammoniphilus sp. CFH 90114]RXT13863.1 DUF92 domain-containing protein [Ammoniphilus sp. CFH 90114]
MKIALGFICSLLVSYYSFHKKSLSFDGMVASIIVGTIVFSMGSLYWYGLLLAFFASSSILSHYKKANKHQVEELYEKTGQRDATQVMANGGLGALLVIYSFFTSDPTPYMVFYLGIMATVNADTWGTELGVLSKKSPRHILNGKSLQPGESGGISIFGTLSSLLGGLFIGACAVLFLYVEAGVLDWDLIIIGGISGLLGSLVDSLLGASLQRMYKCTKCYRETEKTHHCNQRTHQIRGYRWCNNNMVNSVSSLVGGMCAWLLWKLLL